MRLLDLFQGRGSHPTQPSDVRVKRLTDRPIIRAEMFSDPELMNINGPSLVRMPEWCRGRLGAYHLYFASHSGKTIRLAYSDNIVGPWQIYEPGTLTLQDAPGCHDHIASPDVHIDEEARRIRMYFHGPSVAERGQKTFVATSETGLVFAANPLPIASFYLRMARWRNGWIGMAKGGITYLSKSGLEPLSRVTRSVFPMSNDWANDNSDVRHVALDVSGDQMDVFYTRIGDKPEAILKGTVSLEGKPSRWRVRSRSRILLPEGPDEGADLPARASSAGPSDQMENALRDPAIYREGDARYLLYAVAGESGIAIAEIRPRNE